MQVFILFFSNFNNEDEFMGVYSSEEKARATIARYGRSDQNQMRVESYELDSD